MKNIIYYIRGKHFDLKCIFCYFQLYIYIIGITAIEPEWLPILADHLCYIPKNQNERNTFYDQKNSNVVYIASCTFGMSNLLYIRTFY